MSICNEQWFLKGLTDFTDLKGKGEKEKKSVNDYEFNLDLQANQKLLKSFKEIKEKLKQSIKDNELLKNNILQQQQSINKYKQLEKDIIKKIQQYIQINKQLQQQNQQYQQKIQFAKQSLKHKKQITDQLELYKLKLSQQIQIIESLQNEKQKIIQLSIKQKLQLEETIKKLQAKTIGDHNYIQEIQVTMNKVKSKNIQLQSQLKKMQIRYDQEIYNKKWLNNNYQKDQLQLSLKQLQKQFNQLALKNNKEKDKRCALQKRVLELEEVSSLVTLKAQTYEKESKCMSKKIKKLSKSLEQAEGKLEQVLGECLFWEEKFLKSVGIFQELLSRVKRELTGDIVNLARTCQYKLNKLKEQQKKQKYNSMTKSPSNSKKQKQKQKQNQKTRSKSYYCLPHTPTKKNNQCILQNNQKQLKEQDKALTQTKKNYLYQPPKLNQQLFNQKQKCSQNQSTLVKYNNVELKIRKERQQMQRKIRQKILYNKIDITTSSPEKHYLRSEYLKLMNI